jgi:hypothetical protein
MMKRFSLAACFAALVAISASVEAAGKAFNVTVDGLNAGGEIAAPQALCVPTADGKSEPIPNVMRPTIRWAGTPKGTASFAVFMMDPDVPADFTDAGKVGKVIAADAPRQDFYHWAVVDIPASATSIPGGLAKLPLKAGRELPNNLGAAGYVPTPGQYGGPCPPWNDARIHNYHFIVLALDAATPPAGADEPAKAAFTRLIASPHVLGKATVVGTYTLNQQLRAAQH